MAAENTDGLVQERFPELYHDHGPTPPYHLLTQRARSTLKKVGNGWPSYGYFGLPIPPSEIKSALAAGAEEAPPAGSWQRLSVRREYAKSPEVQPYVPFVAAKIFRPFPFQLIPTSSYGSSLKNLLTNESWHQLSAHTINHAGHVCEMCGEGGDKLEAHEIWEFHTPLHPGAEGVQKLVQLVAVCDDCHDIFHPSIASAKKKYPESIDRMSALNGWTSEETAEYVAWAAAVQKFRSSFDWVLDLSDFAHVGQLQVNANWLIDDTAGRFRCTNERIARLGRTHTLLIGIPFAIDDEPIMSEPVAAYYELLSFPSEGVEDEPSQSVPA